MVGPVSNWKRYVISAVLGTDVPLWITFANGYKEVEGRSPRTAPTRMGADRLAYAD